MTKRFLFFDCETYSEVELSDVGAFEYSVHKSTEMVCASWRLGTRETILGEPFEMWCKKLGFGREIRLRQLLADPTIYKIAHNSGFDRLIVENVLKIPQPIETWIDSAAMAAAHALPRNLAGACEVLQLPVQKNPDGKRLIQKFSKPRKPTKANPSTRYENDEELMKFVFYCRDDVDAMIGLFLALPPLSASEREVFKLNQRINTRGVMVDRRMVKCALSMIEIETRRLTGELQEVTEGRLKTAGQRDATLELLANEGLTLPDLRRPTVENALASGLAEKASPIARRVCEIRLSASKTSTAKYESFWARTAYDGRLRDLQMYHGASTGRESGMGLQPHNLPKPTLENVPDAVKAIKSGDVQWVRALCGDVMEALSSSIRGVIIPTPGYDMFCADFNAIEARVLLWMASDTVGLEAFEKGDPYKDEAAGIYQKPVGEITAAERDIGKRTVLGCGFQMSAKKFYLTCLTAGLDITPELAKRAVKNFRSKHPQVPKMWNAMERTAILAVQNPNTAHKCCKTTWFKPRNSKFLYCQLPSGRRIAYFGPEIREEPTPWGETRPKLYRWYQDSQKRKWKQGGTYGGELCIARDTLVLTSEGWKPIQLIRPRTQVWDGEEWVHTDGLVHKGRKEVIKAFGAWMTHDHQVLTKRGWQNASQSERYSRASCRVPDSFKIPRVRRLQISLGSQMRVRGAESLSSNGTYERLQKEAVNVLRMQKERVYREAFDFTRNVQTSGIRSVAFDERSVQTPYSSSLAQLRRARYQGMRTMAEKFREFLGRHGAKISTRTIYRPDRQRRKLSARELSLGDAQAASEQPTKIEEVYDLINCGSKNRFVIWANGPLIVHNCENVVQATARDLMVEAQLRVEAKGYVPLFSVHDELVHEKRMGEGTVEEFEQTMAALPPWADGLALRVKGFKTDRYRKG